MPPTGNDNDPSTKSPDMVIVADTCGMLLMCTGAYYVQHSELIFYCVVAKNARSLSQNPSAMAAYATLISKLCSQLHNAFQAESIQMALNEPTASASDASRSHVLTSQNGDVMCSLMTDRHKYLISRSSMVTTCMLTNKTR